MSVRLELKWRGSRKLKRELDKMIKRTPDAVVAAAMQEANQVMDISNSHVPTYLGDILSSAFIKREGLKILLGYNSKHAVYQHEGTSGGRMPPKERLAPWAEAKMGDARLWWPVALKIAEVGVPPLKFLENAMKERLPGMAHRIARRVRGRL